MDRWKIIAIIAIEAVSLSVPAVAQPSRAVAPATRQHPSASQLSPPAAPSGLTVSAGPTQSPESSQGTEPLKRSDIPAPRPDPATTPKATGKDPVISGSATASEQIRATQAALKSKGLDPGPVDGIPGPKTAAALRSFQRAENLPESGRGDDRTLSKLGVQ